MINIPPRCIQYQGTPADGPTGSNVIRKYYSDTDVIRKYHSGSKVIIWEWQFKYKCYCRWRRWRYCNTIFCLRDHWLELPATAAAYEQRSQNGNGGCVDSVAMDTRPIGAIPNFNFKGDLCMCFRAFVLRSCLFMSFFSCTPRV